MNIIITVMCVEKNKPAEDLGSVWNRAEEKNHLKYTYVYVQEKNVTWNWYWYT